MSCVCSSAEPEKLCGSASLTSSKTPPSPRSWKTTPPPNVGWPNWWRTCRMVRSQTPGASLYPRSDTHSSPSLRNTSKELPNTWRAFSFKHEHTDRQHCLNERLEKGKALNLMIFVFRSTSSAIPFPWIHGFIDFHICCLAICSPTDLQVNNKLLHNIEQLQHHHSDVTLPDTLPLLQTGGRCVFLIRYLNGVFLYLVTIMFCIIEDFCR